VKLFGKERKIPFSGAGHPLIAIKDMVLFPHSAAPIYVQKASAVKSIEHAMTAKRTIVLAYFTGEDTKLELENLNPYATVARIVQVMKLPNNSSRVLLEGGDRVSLHAVREEDGLYIGRTNPISLDNSLGKEVVNRMRALQESFRGFAKDNKKVPKEILQAIDRADNPHTLMDQILSQTAIPYRRKLELFNITDTLQRLEQLSVELESEHQVLSIKKDISKRVKQRMDDNHREFVINEQIKELNRELGKAEDDPSGVAELEAQLKDRLLPAEVRAKVDSEFKRLKRLQPISPEAGIVRGYLEWIADLPWEVLSDDRIEIDEAATILDEDHYDMTEPKDRILDYLSVLQMKQNLKGPILCFVGPPGTGKTSLGKSLARAMGREFVRISLGGVRDEAEIRGHRRTYVGALPGKIIQGLKKAGSSNPVFLLDEIDKLSSDHRGDPSSALLEVLDPEQNKNFTDHYMEVAVDLSKVLFVTTANSLEGIPYPLLDRMEIIQIPGYTRIEKLKIAEGFIIPKQLREHGLDWADVRFSSEALKLIIDHYTRESGVRNLEREIAKAVRKIARKAVEDGKIPVPVSPEPAGPPEASAVPQENAATGEAQDQEPEPALAEPENQTGLPAVTDETDAQSDSEPAAEPALGNEDEIEIQGGQDENSGTPREDDTYDEADSSEGISLQEDISYEYPDFKYRVTNKLVHKLLGPEKFDSDLLYKETPPGLVYGMAWTQMGGKLLPVEAIILNREGKGEMTLTGSLGDVMKESARIALSVARKLMEESGKSPAAKLAQNADIHIHVPAGAIPKDGPSAGITLTCALLSIFTHTPLRDYTAMTGEITLTGRVLPVGGIKEKVLAAHRNGFKTIILPSKNRKDYEELPQEVKKAIRFEFAEEISDVREKGFTEKSPV
jgi:ATP-dependent Lon protease